MCGEELQNAWDFLEEHQEIKERLFECKLCTFTSIYDAEIRNHMIKHVENVLTPNLSQMQEMYNEEIEEKLATLEENNEYDEDYFDPDIMSRLYEDGNLKNVDNQSETAESW